MNEGMIEKNEEKKFVFLAFFSYIAAFLYTYVFTEFFNYVSLLDKEPISWIGICLFLLFVGSFVGMTEYLFRKQAFTRTALFWLVILALSCLSMCLNLPVWSGWNILLLHVIALYYVMTRSGKLIALETSAYILLDAFHMGLAFPYRYIFQRIKIIFRPSEKKGFSFKTLVWILGALIISLLLLFMATGLLSEADTSFGAAMETINSFVENLQLEGILIRFILSIPVGACIFGLLYGAWITTRQDLETETQKIEGQLSRAHQVPSLVWMVIAGVFSLFYLFFFILQAGYLFSALNGVIPEGFTAASYARQGFFELCKVIMVNFMLIFLIEKTAKASSAPALFEKLCLSFIVLESILFSLISQSKLILYISRFGLTSLRIMSFWLVISLTAGCIAYLVHLWTGKKTFRLFFLFCVILQVITQFIPLI